MTNDLIYIARANAALRSHGVSPEIAHKLVKRHGHNRINEILKHELHLLEKLVREEMEKIDELEEKIEELEEIIVGQKPVAVSSVLKFKTSQGVTTMPLTVHLNDTPGDAIYQEFAAPNGQGQVVPPTGIVLFKSSDETVATVDPSTGKLAYIKAGQTTISADDGGNLPASDVLTVTDPVAVSSTLTLNPGVAPAAAARR